MTSAQESTNSPFNSLRRLFKREKKVAVAPTIIPAKAVDATGRWSTYTQQYRNGDFDFESPPPPPAQLGAGESFAAPIPRKSVLLLTARFATYSLLLDRSHLEPSFSFLNLTRPLTHSTSQ